MNDIVRFRDLKHRFENLGERERIAFLRSYKLSVLPATPKEHSRILFHLFYIMTDTNDLERRLKEKFSVYGV